MSRLAAQIELLERAASIAGQAIWPDQNNITVPASTLQTLGEQLEEERDRPTEYRLIGSEAVWLLQASKQVVLHRLDRNAAMVERWTRLSELLRSAVALDLVNARKSLGMVEPQPLPRINQLVLKRE